MAITTPYPPAAAPAVPSRPAAVDYPESDGKPMGETETHVRCSIDVITMLRLHFRSHPDVHVGGNLLLYYQEGHPKQRVCPDVFVVRGLREPGHERRVYRLWEEGRPPDFVLELTSRSTRHVDTGRKRELYAHLGIQDYFLYDPLGEYLRPGLQGYRLSAGAYEPIRPSGEGRFTSTALGLELGQREGELRFYDPVAGRWLLTPAETEAARQAAEAARQAAEVARRAAEARVADEAAARREVEAELARLRAELGHLRQQP